METEYYKIHFEDDGFASMYETDDMNYWTYEEAQAIVRMENEKLEKNDEEMPDEIYQALFLVAVELYRMGVKNEALSVSTYSQR